MTTTRSNLSRGWLAVSAGLVLIVGALAALTVLVLPLEADEPPPPIAGVELAPERGQFTDDVAVQVRDRPAGRPTEVINLRDASHVAAMEITIQPGAQFPWHTHPGPVFVTIAEGDPDGAFVYVYGDDCVERPYGVGEAFVDPGGDNVHTAFNPSDTHETVVIATFFGVPSDGPLTVPADAEIAEALNASCDTNAPVPQGSSHDH